LEKAFSAAEKLNVHRLLEPNDFDNPDDIDEKSVVLYLTKLWQALHDQ